MNKDQQIIERAIWAYAARLLALNQCKAKRQKDGSALIEIHDARRHLATLGWDKDLNLIWHDPEVGE
jgi:hypothetical protein